MSGIWVWLEKRGDSLSMISREAIGAARQIAGALGQPVTGIALGHNVGDLATAAFDLGVDAVLGADDAALASFRIEAIGPVFTKLAQDRQPSVILFGNSGRGHDLAAWVAADLDAGLVADAISLEVDGGVVKATRPVYAGKLLATAFVKEGVQLLTLRNRAFPAAEATGKTGNAEWVAAGVDETAVATKITAFEAKQGTVSLTDARIIVSGGRGVGGPEGFAPVRELSEALGGALGASRAAVDAGWIPYDHQVGQTGKTVSPDLYVACGISGAIQHQAGMRTSKVIVAINKDGDAPIFGIAHYGIVGDLFKIAPALSAEFRKRLGK